MFADVVSNIIKKRKQKFIKISLGIAAYSCLPWKAITNFYREAGCLQRTRESY